MARFDVIAFDADDTLWHNEQYYIAAQTEFKQLLAQYHSPEWIAERLYQTEMRNIQHYGYGIKAFALSMIETAVELTEGRIMGKDIMALVDVARKMMAAEVELVQHVPETLARLAEMHMLMVITKGDLNDQEAKIARSGLAPYFRDVEIVSDKSAASYAKLLGRHKIAPEKFMMVGNSLRSDILPVLAVGASAVYVPHPLTWAHEAAEPPAQAANFFEIKEIGELPELVESLERG